MNTLPHLRKSVRTQRQQLPPDTIMSASHSIAEKIFSLNEFQNAQHVAFYAAQENEVDLSVLFYHVLSSNKTPYLPIFSEKNEKCLSFSRIDRQTKFKKNKWGIDEPLMNDDTLIETVELDVIFLPLVMFDAQCHRVGRGRGCYDRCLQFALNKTKNTRPTLIGLAYEFQKVETIVPQSWDVEMDFVMTEVRVYVRQ